jgi:hypothetical protein
MVSHELLFVPFSIHLLPSPTVFFYLLERKIFKRLSRVLNLKGIYRNCLIVPAATWRTFWKYVVWRIKENTVENRIFAVSSPSSTHQNQFMLL